MRRGPVDPLGWWQKRAAIFAALFLCIPLIAHADDVTIRDREGGTLITGEVLGFDGTYLRLGTRFGDLTLGYDPAGCDGSACPDLADHVPMVRISGSRRLGDVLLPALVEGYARRVELRAIRRAIDGNNLTYLLVTPADRLPRLGFEFRLATAGEGFADLLADEADIAMSVRQVSPDEVARAEAAGLGRLDGLGRSRIIALDGLVPIMSPDRSMGDLTLGDLAEVLTGDADVAVHLSGQATQDHVASLGLTVPELSPGTTYHDSWSDVADAVALGDNALGIVPFGREGNAVPLAISDACGGQMPATRLSLKTEDYPLTRPVFLYIPRRRLPPEAMAWLSWLRSEEAQLIVRRAGYVDREAEPIPIRLQGNRLRRAIQEAGPEVSLDELQSMLDFLSGGVRLSTTFRFELGSTRLDAQSRSNLLTLAQALLDGGYGDSRLVLIGFSDGRGPADANLDLSLARADAVRRELLGVLGGRLPPDVAIEVRSFGEALPIGCDDTDWGRQMNRRVELWLMDQSSP